MSLTNFLNVSPSSILDITVVNRLSTSSAGPGQRCPHCVVTVDRVQVSHLTLDLIPGGMYTLIYMLKDYRFLHGSMISEDLDTEK